MCACRRAAVRRHAARAADLRPPRLQAAGLLCPGQLLLRLPGPDGAPAGTPRTRLSPRAGLFPGSSDGVPATLCLPPSAQQGQREPLYMFARARRCLQPCLPPAEAAPTHINSHPCWDRIVFKGSVVFKSSVVLWSRFPCSCRAEGQPTRGPALPAGGELHHACGPWPARPGRRLQVC